MYVLKHFDDDLLKFEVLENLEDPVVKIVWINKEKIHMLPMGMAVTDEGVSKWLKRRVIPTNRAFADSFLAKCGLSANRPMDIISVCRGLSLNDSCWVAEERIKALLRR